MILLFVLIKIRVININSTYIHNITPVSHWGRQRSLPSTCYVRSLHFSLLPLSSNSSYMPVSGTLDLALVLNLPNLVKNGNVVLIDNNTYECMCIFVPTRYTVWQHTYIPFKLVQAYDDELRSYSEFIIIFQPLLHTSYPQKRYEVEEVHTAIKIRRLLLWPAACLTSTLLENSVGAKILLWDVKINKKIIAMSNTEDVVRPSRSDRSLSLLWFFGPR
jgi:hypothetical protein